ncbi:MAG TPA: ankyrin repeat domain-containing protein [Thermoanaerobaculia bacterium]|jgi:ankyrin repeat protein|nr:ankyrin repeat domain-containing protein [Thermoanaerobaculia bacterium]
MSADNSATQPADRPTLPQDPDLELLRKQAKRLLRAARDGDPDALARVRRALDRFAALGDSALGVTLRLADVQQAVARELGFPSWPKLVRHVEERQPLALQVERFLRALNEHRAVTAARILRRRPEIGRAGIFAACAAGEPEVVAVAIAADPGVIDATHQPDGGTPLIYACASPLHTSSPERARGIRRCAELLLDAGADPNQHTLFEEPSGNTAPIAALYYACVTDHRELVATLLARGANPNDGESIYHAAELDHEACLELLLAHGADVSGRHPQYGNTPLFFLAGYKDFHESTAAATRGMAWLLAHGADPNVTSYKVEETPLHRIAANGRGPAVAEMLLAHGAAVDQPRADGKTAYAMAVRAGNVATAETLRAHGADPARLTPADRLLGACMVADEAAARAVLAEHPDLVAQLSDEDRQAFALAAEEGHEASVRLMHALGFDFRWEGEWGGTPLHHAAWHGNVAMTRLLIGLGTPLNVRDRVYGSSALGWAGHGSVHCRKDADDDYVAVVTALLDAGADRETSINRWGEPPENMSSRRVARLLKERSIAS